jgi:hypothetical protein
MRDQRVGCNHWRVDAIARHGGKRCLDFLQIARLDANDLNADRLRRRTDAFQHGQFGRAAGVGKHGDTRHAGRDRAKQLQRLRADVEVAVGHAREIASRMGQARDEAAADGITGARKDDRNRRRRLPRCPDRGRGSGDDEIDLESHKIRGVSGKPVVLAVRIASFDDQILAFDIAEFMQPRLRRVESARLKIELARGGDQKADAPDPLRLLRGGVHPRAEEDDCEGAD